MTDLRALIEAVRPMTANDFAGIDAEPEGHMGDNLAVALCTYFDGHFARPDDGEEGSELDEYDCWKVWVSGNADLILQRIAERANELMTARLAALRAKLAEGE